MLTKSNVFVDILWAPACRLRTLSLRKRAIEVGGERPTLTESEREAESYRACFFTPLRDLVGITLSLSFHAHTLSSEWGHACWAFQQLPWPELDSGSSWPVSGFRRTYTICINCINGAESCWSRALFGGQMNPSSSSDGHGPPFKRFCAAKWQENALCLIDTRFAGLTVNGGVKGQTRGPPSIGTRGRDELCWGTPSPRF